MAHEFKNLPLTDFAIESERNAFAHEVNKIIEQLAHSPFEVFPIIEGKEARSLEPQVLISMPENSQVPITATIEANVEICNRAIESLEAFYPEWSETDVEYRCKILEKAADIMGEKRHYLSSVMVTEVGKPWTEADADLAEAVDFCRYYAQEARKLFTQKKLGNLQGELNLYFYEPRGTTLVISPWNFPLAIPCGMFCASLVTGNCTILKPAEQSVFIAKLLFDIFLEAGMPPRAAAFLPGPGEVIGDNMSKDPRISTIVFTGSKQVGLSLISSGGNTSPQQRHVKKVIAEMGGKNAIVIDSDADLDEAVKGVLQSSFGFVGQKCSACSRVYVASSHVYELFLKRLSDAVSDLRIGPATQPTYFAGPVISRESQHRIQKIIDATSAEYPIFAQTKISADILSQGYFVAPTVFANIPEDHQIMKEEIFGPVVVVNKVEDIKEGIEKALNSEYRLTGGFFSRSPAGIEYAIKNFKVGNLYINRGCTGALVYRQPFGGAYMSGVGSKAGGPDYLLQFVIPRAVSENTMRRGFAPEVA